MNSILSIALALVGTVFGLGFVAWLSSQRQKYDEYVYVVFANSQQRMYVFSTKESAQRCLESLQSADLTLKYEIYSILMDSDFDEQEEEEKEEEEEEKEEQEEEEEEEEEEQEEEKEEEEEEKEEEGEEEEEEEQEEEEQQEEKEEEEEEEDRNEKTKQLDTPSSISTTSSTNTSEAPSPASPTKEAVTLPTTSTVDPWESFRQHQHSVTTLRSTNVTPLFAEMNRQQTRDAVCKRNGNGGHISNLIAAAGGEQGVSEMFSIRNNRNDTDDNSIVQHWTNE